MTINYCEMNNKTRIINAEFSGLYRGRKIRKGNSMALLLG
jgi:hypothetical protein